MFKATTKKSIWPRQNESRNSNREVREIMRPNYMVLVSGHIYMGSLLKMRGKEAYFNGVDLIKYVL